MIGNDRHLTQGARITLMDNKTTTDNNRFTVNKMFKYIVNNIFSFTVGVMGAVHLTLLFIFLFAGVMPLFYFNILSVVVYVFCYILCKSGQIKPAYFSLILEVTFYTVLSTHFIGLRCGTYCFLFSIVPIIIYFGCTLFKGKQRWSVVMMLFLNFATFVALYLRFFSVPPVYNVSPMIMIVLVLLSAFAMVFSCMFYNAVYIYLSENRVTILEARNKKLSADASEDALTSLLNRRGFLPLVDSLMNKAADKQFCVAFCDLDDFKRVNDSYGHEAGDEVLKNATLMIREELPGSDICRWGGEEFVILLKGCNLASARSRVERLRKTVESNPTVFANKKIFVTTTIGLAENDGTFNTPEEIIKKADERMYYGKQHGKNVVISEDKE